MSDFSEKWITRFMGLARHVANFSEYPGTKVGAVIVSPQKQIISMGYNGCPRGVEATDARFSDENKYLWVEHAERNALYNALRNGSPVTGSAIFATHFPCADCARGIIQSGIETVYFEKKLDTAQWIESTLASEIMMKEANIKVF